MLTRAQIGGAFFGLTEYSEYSEYVGAVLLKRYHNLLQLYSTRRYEYRFCGAMRTRRLLAVGGASLAWAGVTVRLHLSSLLSPG